MVMQEAHHQHRNTQEMAFNLCGSVTESSSVAQRATEIFLPLLIKLLIKHISPNSDQTYLLLRFRFREAIFTNISGNFAPSNQTSLQIVHIIHLNICHTLIEVLTFSPEQPTVVENCFSLLGNLGLGGDLDSESQYCKTNR